MKTANFRQPSGRFASWKSLIVTLVLFACLANIGRSQSTGTPPAKMSYPGWSQLIQQSSTGDSVDWLLTRSVVEAERFRQHWIAKDRYEPKSDSLARLTVAFQSQADGQTTMPLADFKCSQNAVRQAFQGNKSEIVPGSVYGPFTGKWYGRWTDFDVDHHWGQVDLYDPPRRLRVDKAVVELTASQYAWIGDGYGFNLVCRRRESEHAMNYLLGYVEHIQGDDFGHVTARRPHVGMVCGEGKIVWFTSKEVFFEATHFQNGQAIEYSISGFEYSFDEERFWILRVFETRYGRDPRNRTEFRELPIRVEVIRQPAE